MALILSLLAFLIEMIFGPTTREAVVGPPSPTLALLKDGNRLLMLVAIVLGVLGLYRNWRFGKATAAHESAPRMTGPVDPGSGKERP